MAANKNNLTASFVGLAPTGRIDHQTFNKLYNEERSDQKHKPGSRKQRRDAQHSKNGVAGVNPVDKTQVGMTCELKNLYQKLDKAKKVVWVNEYPDDLDEPVENEETAKFALIVRNKKSYDSRKKLEIDSIIVQSPLLKSALEPVLKDYPGITINLERLTFQSPFQPFVHRWERFVDTLHRTPPDTAAYQHLALLHTVLEAELRDLIATKEDHVANGVITFHHMWTIFEPGALIYSLQDGVHDCLWALTSTGKPTEDRERGGALFIPIVATCVDYDGGKFGTQSQMLRNYEFVGTTKITNLNAYPLEFHPNKEGIVKALLERGRRVEKYAGYHYMAYRGVALGYGRCGMIKHSVDSRIIIDTEAHNRFLPNRAISVLPLRRTAKDIGDDEDFTTDENKDSDGDSSSSTVDRPNSSSHPANLTRPHRPLNRRELLTLVPYVRGYALKSKKWLWFFVSGIRHINFNTEAFSSLVLPSQQKDLILAFVESQIRQREYLSALLANTDANVSAPVAVFDDIIAGKGRGMILLLSGPPGVGKTLTAESVAEHLRAPLYTLSAGDLGLEPESIESSLSTILEMAAKWSAVLLLDEADVFLEARSSHDLERNKMVSIFLRVLEYYEGILFLTTNRVANVDEAFHSRIHISLEYPALGRDSRRHIWKTFTEGKGGGKVELEDGELDELSEVQINGRQIKNVLKTAGMLAASRFDKGDADDGVIRMAHVRTVLGVGRRV